MVQTSGSTSRVIHHSHRHVPYGLQSNLYDLIVLVFQHALFFEVSAVKMIRTEWICG